MLCLCGHKWACLDMDVACIGCVLFSFMIELRYMVGKPVSGTLLLTPGVCSNLFSIPYGSCGMLSDCRAIEEEIRI